MLARNRCLRLSTPLTSLSGAAMPLRAKVTNPAIARQATMATSASPTTEDVLFTNVYGVRSIELNRPKKLNALTTPMINMIAPRLKELEKSQLANIIVISGAGANAFCAGGDVATLAKQNQVGKEGQAISKKFFGLEYQLNHLIATYSKPYIAILDGITMGGGVGLSVHAPFRIATEKTLFAMPETTIGFFPDVGGSFFLPRMDGQLGTYLALTSERLTGVQALYAGIATHYFHSSSLPNLIARLGELVFPDSAPLSERLDLVNRTIAEFTTGLPPLSEEPIKFAGGLREAIDRCFKYNTLEEIISALEKEEGPHKEWATKTLETLSHRSPTALKVTLRTLRLGKNWTISEAFQREYHIAGHFMGHHDFVEGVTALLVEKRKPKWQPATLAEVSDKAVSNFFEVPIGESRLKLLNPEANFKRYPHARFALPTEDEILEAANKAPDGSTADIVAAFVNKWGGKDGVENKVREVLARHKTHGENEGSPV